MKRKLLFTLFIFLFMLFLSNYTHAYTIVLDPGHGGKDSGAINKKLNLYERDVTWNIANYMKSYLEDYANTKVILTCPTLEKTGDSLGRDQRAEIMMKNNADLALSIHIDSSTSPKQNGATAYITAYPKYNSAMTELSKKLLSNLNKIGIASNGVKTRKTESNDGYYDDGTPLDYYGIIRYPTLFDIPIVLLEHCYISNESDCKFIDSAEDLKKIAKSDADAIASYLNLIKKSEITPTPKQTPSPTPTPLPEINPIEGVTLNNIKLSEKYITNILSGETVKDVKARIKTDYKITFTDKDGNFLEDTSHIKNCTKLVLTDNDEIKLEYIITIYGDLDCDGLITSIDLLVLQRHILELSILKDDILKAGNISKDNSLPTSIDLLKIQRHILEIEYIK